jgi:DNA-directed RNA polymerase specialized sigma24 family protein
MTSEERRREGRSLRELAGRWRRVPKEDRLVFLWKRMGFSDEEIAGRVGKSLSAVRAAYRRAAALMR